MPLALPAGSRSALIDSQLHWPPGVEHILDERIGDLGFCRWKQIK